MVVRLPSGQDGCQHEGPVRAEKRENERMPWGLHWVGRYRCQRHASNLPVPYCDQGEKFLLQPGLPLVPIAGPCIDTEKRDALQSLPGDCVHHLGVRERGRGRILQSEVARNIRWGTSSQSRSLQGATGLTIPCALFATRRALVGRDHECCMCKCACQLARPICISLRHDYCHGRSERRVSGGWKKIGNNC